MQAAQLPNKLFADICITNIVQMYYCNSTTNVFRILIITCSKFFQVASEECIGYMCLFHREFWVMDILPLHTYPHTYPHCKSSRTTTPLPVTLLKIFPAIALDPFTLVHIRTFDKN